jgi:hypothetical protein
VRPAHRASLEVLPLINYAGPALSAQQISIPTTLNERGFTALRDYLRGDHCEGREPKVAEEE